MNNAMFNIKYHDKYVGITIYIVRVISAGRCDPSCEKRKRKSAEAKPRDALPR